jgi:hypothetical protein
VQVLEAFGPRLLGTQATAVGAIEAPKAAFAIVKIAMVSKGATLFFMTSSLLIEGIRTVQD